MIVLLGTDTPTPMPSMTVDPNAVTPGPIGFAVVIVILIAVILLIWDMNRRVRRVRYREEVREELDAEEAANAAGETSDGDAQPTSAEEDGAADTGESPRNT